MLYPRLQLTKQLLSDDGVIFCSKGVRTLFICFADYSFCKGFSYQKITYFIVI